MRGLLSIGAMFCFLFATQAGAAQLAVEDVPQPLKPWVRWVLQGHEEKQCPFLSNSVDRYRCRWPSQLQLVLKDTGSSFNQQWRVLQEGWVPLPGENSHWPQNVMVNAKGRLRASYSRRTVWPSGSVTTLTRPQASYCQRTGLLCPTR